MQILAPVIPSEPTPPGNVPVIMPPNNYDPATATSPPDYDVDFATSGFRTPDGGVYMVMPTQIHYSVRPMGLTTYWDWEKGDYALPDPPNWNCYAWATRRSDGTLSWSNSTPIFQFGTGIDAPPGWAMCSTPPDGYSWPSDMPDGIRWEGSWTLFAEGLTKVDWPLLQAMATEPIEAYVACNKTYLYSSYSVNFAVFKRISTISDRGRQAAAGIVPIISTLFGLAVLLGSGADNSTGRRYVKKRVY